MNPRVKKNLIKYGCCLLVDILITCIFVGLRDFSAEDLSGKCYMIGDGLSVAGVLLLMAGCLVWSSNMGALYSLGYMGSHVVRSLIPGAMYKHETYGDYVERKREKKIKGYSFLFIAGGVTLAIAILLLVIFYPAS